jgi:CBS domain-containing protein
MHASDPVNRLMTEPVLTVDINDPAGEVLRLFAGYPVHHLPVLDKRRVVGMLSSADVMKLELFVPRNGPAPIEYLNQRMKVGALLRRAPLTILPHQPVEAAARLMAENGVHALVVVDGADQVLGIITTTDIMHAALGIRGGGTGPAGTGETSAGDVRASGVTEEQMAQALVAAAARAGTEGDVDFVHRALLHLHERMRGLEQIRLLAGRYLHGGQDQQLHAALRRALDRAAKG